MFSSFDKFNGQSKTSERRGKSVKKKVENFSFLQAKHEFIFSFSLELCKACCRPFCDEQIAWCCFELETPVFKQIFIRF